MEVVTREVTVSTASIGFHCWPEAVGERTYLSDRHRHLFHYRVTVPVAHNDRDIEFHDLLDITRSSPPLTRSEHDRSSCEDLAAEIAETIFTNYPHLNWVRVEVTEDDEVAATLTFQQEDIEQ